MDYDYGNIRNLHEPKLVGAKINISKEETEGDSACCGAGLELQGLKQGGEKSANLRLKEELLQAREAALNLNSKGLQRESK
ncbi:LOW QUALITY PROTEIN: uncharacterized protein RDI95_009679 [Morus bassanus]